MQWSITFTQFTVPDLCNKIIVIIYVKKNSLLRQESSSISAITVTNQGDNKLLRNLNPYKAMGPDKISPRFLKELHEELSPILTHILKFLFKSGKVPDDWKKHSLQPSSKKGQKNNPANK